MEKRYDVYCIADPVFFDSPATAADKDLAFGVTDRPLPAGWTRSPQDDWLVCRPDGARRPGQGWKIHASARMDNAEKVLDAVWNYCLDRGIPFKFLKGRHVLQTRNMKYAPRAASGKLVTIYPQDEKELRETLEGLDREIGGEPGPYILSDLRWGAGPLYVRYGGFTERHVISDKGVLEPAVERPDGTLVPDRREPGFHVPSWVTLPGFLEPHLRAREADSVADLPYRVQRVLHFSNGGGVYVAEDTRDGRQVILKEARPHAGLTVDGADAVTRLCWERDILRRLAGLDAVPAVLDHVLLGDHHFLVQEFIEGQPLSKTFAQRYPYTGARTDAAGIAEYTEWAVGVCERLESAVATLHERGVIFGDLHPYNVMVRPDGRVSLIDFEVATLAGDGKRPTLGHPAYAAPRDRTGFDVDRYALGCIRLAVFLPLTALLRQDLGKCVQFADEIAERFPVDREFLDRAVRDILGEGPRDGSAGPPVPAGSSGERRPAYSAPVRLTADPASWPATRDALAGAVLASATPERDDRLFPGDIAQFGAGGGVSLAYGAAGVLYALGATGAGRRPEHEQWLLRSALRKDQRGRLGFYDGLHGVAHALHGLGHRGAALDLLELCLHEKWERLGSDLFSGLAGVGLNLAHFAALTGDGSLREAALRAAALVASRLGGEQDVAEVSGGKHPYAGLMRGSAGIALLFLRLYEQQGDEAFLDLAATALRQDLRRCFTRADGALQVNEGWRTMPYLATGGAGLALVLEAYLRHREDEQFAIAAAGARLSSRSEFYVQSGLFNGRAGILAHLAATTRHPSPADDPEIARQVRALNWHALSYQGRPAFPGEQLLRLSMDLATGTAGVLLALGSVLHDRPVHLPFLSPHHPTDQLSDDGGRPQDGHRVSTQEGGDQP
ncbi:class III lanthionine synthetase LanKC [Streptomyces sp. NPDC056987]|uniref:class III lanthionine synthetase LanKC n=1 Tax=Streptomyces sp. NPDC056987 TaxID=3345988 RepID=UPI0036356868